MISHFTLKTALRFLGFKILHNRRTFCDLFLRFTLNFQDYLNTFQIAKCCQRLSISCFFVASVLSLHHTLFFNSQSTALKISEKLK